MDAMGWPMPEITLSLGQLVALIFVTAVFSNIIGGVLLHCYFRWWCQTVRVLDGIWVKSPRE